MAPFLSLMFLVQILMANAMSVQDPYKVQAIKGNGIFKRSASYDPQASERDTGYFIGGQPEPYPETDFSNADPSVCADKRRFECEYLAARNHCGARALQKFCPKACNLCH